MKKVFLIIILILSYSSINANALSFNNGSVSTRSGGTLSYDEYNSLKLKYNDELIEFFDNDKIQDRLNSDLVYTEKYIITTYEYNRMGMIINANEMVGTRDQAIEVANDEKYYVSADGRLEYNDRNLVSFTVYSTSSKVIQGAYYFDHKPKDSGDYEDKYKIEMYVSWYTTPVIKKYDVLASRWTTSNSADYFWGKQECDSNTGITYYNQSSTNLVSNNYGLGITMNIHDSAQNMIELTYYVEDVSSFGSNVYGTYQHARNSNITLSGSMSYSFSSSGLGGVLYYSNPTISNYYDGMQGITMPYQYISYP